MYLRTLLNRFLPASKSLHACSTTASNHSVTDHSNPTTAISDQHPLKNIRVLDVSRIIAGPFCTQLLSDLGADVIKVERPHTGDESRRWGPPFLSNSNDSVYFTAANRNKRSICIDMKRGAQLITQLAAECDVLVENFVPGKMDEFGLGYEQLRASCPRLVYCSVSGYGSVGPYAKRPGYDVIAASMGGLLHITGDAAGGPAKVGVAMTDIATGLYAHGAIMAALLQRERTGRGQNINVDLLSTQIASLINVGANYLNAGQEAERWGTSHASIVPYQTFRTADGYLTIGAGSDEQFRVLCERIGRPELTQDVRFVGNQQRVANREEIVRVLSEIMAQETNDEWLRRFVDAPFPVGPVNSIAQVFADPHVEAIGLVQELQHSQAGAIRVVGPPVKYSEAANTARTAPPTLGQHTDEVLRSMLGMDNGTIAKLREDKIVQ